LHLPLLHMAYNAMLLIWCRKILRHRSRMLSPSYKLQPLADWPVAAKRHVHNADGSYSLVDFEQQWGLYAVVAASAP